MTRASDVKQLIAADSSSPAEERALQDLARRLEGGLGQEVPYRPEFKAELRSQLVKAARRQLRPWYRRPAFLGSGVAVAAAAAVLVVGLNLWQKDGAQQVNPNVALTPPAAEAPEESTGFASHGSSSATLVSLPSDLREVALPDEPLRNDQYFPEANTAGATARRMELKRLTAKPGEEEFQALERQLAFRGESRRSMVGWSIDEGGRLLAMTVDGRVTYQQDAAAAPDSAGVIDTDGARQAARQFLDRALLPVPAAQPDVVPEEGLFTVIYTENLEGRPVVNARTTVQVEQHGAVVRAEAYVASGTVSGGAYDAVTEAEALAEARAQGGRFDRADLVWVRTPGEEVVYLQPYWRAFGTDAHGQSVVRYVPALKR